MLAGDKRGKEGLVINKFCPRCYAPNSIAVTKCQECGAFLDESRNEAYLDKLIWALEHRDRETVLRAITILGMLGPEAEAAVPALQEVFKKVLVILISRQTRPWPS